MELVFDSNNAFMYNQIMEDSIEQLKKDLKKAYADIEYLKETLRMERELYVNIRELLKCRDREVNRLNDYIEQIKKEV